MWRNYVKEFVISNLWLTVQQNLIFALKGMPKNDTKRITQHYINLVGLKGFEQLFPYQISGGMLKRVELARALAQVRHAKG